MSDALRLFLSRRLRQVGQRGASAVEYGLLVAGVALACVLVLPHLGHVAKTQFHNNCSHDAGTNGSC